MIQVSRTAACAGLLAGLIGAATATEAGLAATPTVELTSSGGGVYDYTFVGVDGIDTRFLNGQTITLSGLSGVTGASVSGEAAMFFSSSSFTSTSAVFTQTCCGTAGFGDVPIDGFEVSSSVLTTGAVAYTMVTENPGILAGTVEGPVAAAAPEPSTWAMMLLGFAGLGYVGTRKMRRAAVTSA
jgi:hypothetical protein